MEFSKEQVKQIRNLLLLTALLILLLIHSNKIIEGILFLLGILKPFLYGGIIAFIINIPMNAFERMLFKNWQGKYAKKFKRPVSLLLSILAVAVLLSVIVWRVIPQLVQSFTEIGREIPAFLVRVQTELDIMGKMNPHLGEIAGELQLMEINWDDVLSEVTHFLKNGASDILSSTVNVVGSIISGVVDGVIAFVFAIYILMGKEKLQNQGKKILTAYCSPKVSGWVQKVCGLLYTNFTNFITGQCLEAVILGSMFTVSMWILRLPYALVVGMVIAVTALIPLVGGYIGCAVGVFLLLIEEPIQAFVFVVMFVVLQQIEGKLIYPKVVGNFVGLPGIWVLFAITVGGSLFGVVGMLVFIPLMSTAYSLLRESVNRRNEKTQ
jgi:predicted PurR-regulated permease PerM